MEKERESLTGYLNSYFAKAPLSQATSAQTVPPLVLHSGMTILEAAEALFEREYLAAPVLNARKPAATTWQDKYLGFLDHLSLIHYLLMKTEGQRPKTLSELLGLSNAVRSVHISEIIAVKRWCPFVGLAAGFNNMLDALLLLGKYGFHRLAVIDEEQQTVHSVITQFGVIKYLQSRPFEEMTLLASAQLWTLGLTYEKPVISIGPHVSLWDGLIKLVEAGVQGLPILDNEGRLIGNLSSHHLRLILADPQTFSDLNAPLSSFPQLFNPAVCTSSTTLQQCLDTLAERHSHRLYLVDDHGKVLRVLSLSDLISKFVREPEDSYFAAFVQHISE